MSNRSVKTRIKDLENKHPDRPMIPIFQDWDDPDQWHPGGRDADPLTWDQVEAEYSNYLILKVSYKDSNKPKP